FEIMQEYKIDRKVFSTADLSAILMGLSSLSGMIRGDELANALAKVRSFVPADRAKDIELKSHQVHIDSSPWMGNRNIQPYLEIIKTALKENKLLSFAYADRYGDMINSCGWNRKRTPLCGKVLSPNKTRREENVREEDYH
ncbi:MAG: hypothetical protein U1D97_04460, partial [Desulfuromonadales bacterium]|nr:hypothetical protein [Desulfuromonadales bacterium]